MHSETISNQSPHFSHLSISPFKFLSFKCLLILFFLQCSKLQAQQKSLIFYQNLLLFEAHQTPQRTTYVPKGINLYEYSLAYRWRKDERKMRQIELKAWYGTPDNARYSHKQIEFILRYDAGRELRKKMFNHVTVTPAVSYGIGILREKVIPKNNYENDLFYFEYFASITGVLHFECPLGNRFSLQAGIPVLSCIIAIDGHGAEIEGVSNRPSDAIIDQDFTGGGTTRVGIQYHLR